jgi:predicted amidophosphoribosyltransferase
VAPALPKDKRRKDRTVYECGECGSKLLGEQYCEDCHRFMRRLGDGGLCPCCSEPVTFQELLDS